MIDVLIVEDSRVIREFLVYLLEQAPGLRVVGSADSGEAALEFLAQHSPDVILMDIHLPGIDGFETTRRIMSTRPIPVVVCTASVRFDEVHTAMRALEAGALAALKKPCGLGDPDCEAEAAAIVSTLAWCSEVKMVRRWSRVPPAEAPASPASTELRPSDRARRDVAMIAIGASTGGPPVLARILSALPPDLAAPILLVQHIADGFTVGFADWLMSVSGLPVHVAASGVAPLPGHVYVAPDDHHLRVGPLGELRIARDEAQGGLRPSVGVLFRSVAERYGHRAVGVLLTGMGRDGAEELKLMADRGALTVAQDQDSSVVFGMPAAALALGAAQYAMNPEQIADLLGAVVPRRAPPSQGANR